MKNLKNSFQYILVGAERSGKSFYAKKIVEQYVKNRGSALVYNIGKESDFPASEYYTIEPLTFAEHIQQFYNSKEKKGHYKLNKTIEYFKCNDQVIHFRDFNRFFYKKKVRMFQVPNREEETAFFKSFYTYVSRCFLVLDDCKACFRYGLNDGHIQLFTRKNHTGKLSSVESLRSKGCDIALMFHSIDHVNTELWDSTTGIIHFKYPFNPTFSKMNNRELEIVLTKVHRVLMTAPQYTAIEIPLRGVNYLKPKEVTIK